MRGSCVESRHFGAAAVVSPAGELVASCGDPDWPAVVRSAIKPFQALPLVLAGGSERFELEAADLSVIVASHGGTPEHVERVRSLLQRGGFGVGDLECGAHPPMDARAARAIDASGEELTALHNNCSGKHAGMLLACRLLELPPRGYTAADHPLQRRIVEELAAICHLDPGSFPVAIDGCSAPTFELPLTALARGFAAWAAPASATLSSARAAALEQLAAAVAAAPGMIAGPGRFTTDLIGATGGRILGKEGAEGVYALAIRGPLPFGVAFKIVDGGGRARDTIALEILIQLGALSREEQRALAAHYRPKLRNWRGPEVGEIVADVEIETVAR